MMKMHIDFIDTQCWARLGNEESLSTVPWPLYDEALLVEVDVTIAVQVGGKLRGTITVPSDADEATVVDAARANPLVSRWLEGTTEVKRVYVVNKLLNLVVTKR